MAFIGKSPSTVFSAASKIQDFTGDGSTVAFDLNFIIPAGGENSLQVFINNIRQKPGSGNSYTLGLDGSNDLKRITFSEAPAASDEIYVIIPVEATNIKNVSDDSVTTAKLADSAVTNAKVSPSAAIADTKLAQITTSSKVATSAIVQPGSPGVYLDGAGSWSAIDTSQIDTNAFNIGLLGFKMAVNEGLTVFNLVDGVVDEFNDESGTDEAEGSNDLYCGTSDYYINSTTPDGSSIPGYSAGFTTSSITEPDTSTAGTNPSYGSGSFGNFTVPCGTSSVTAYAWGAGGGLCKAGTTTPNWGPGGGGGFASGAIAVTGGQTLRVVVGEGGQRQTSRSLGGGGAVAQTSPGGIGGGGGGLSGVFNSCVPGTASCGTANATAPQVYVVAGAGGGGGHVANPHSPPFNQFTGGAGGGLTGDAGGQSGNLEQTGFNFMSGGGGDQEQGGQGGDDGDAQNGSLFLGGNSNPDDNTGGGGSGFYGGGGATSNAPGGPAGPDSDDRRFGGGGSSYYGHPQVSSGATEEGTGPEGGGVTDPNYVPGTNESPDALSPSGSTPSAGPYGMGGEDGYVLLSVAPVCASATSTTIVSDTFTSTTVPTSSRIVVFEEDVDTPTLNTDIIASVSRDGTNFTTATLSDSGYVTGSSGQRILTGQADISGQPSGQSMRWKLTLANNQVKIHGVSLQWD